MGDGHIGGDDKRIGICRTVIDLSSRVQVTFENPKWQRFIDDVVKKACDALGVDHYTCKPRCELNKMLLYEEGSQYVSVPSCD